MRKTFSRIALAAATVLLLGSCSKINERIDGLEGRIDGIENETIKTIDGQIASINTSIADLGTIRSNIQDLKSKTEAQAGQIGDLQETDTQLGKKIEALESANEAIGERIDNLQKYVNDTLKVYATTEWVNATFSTLAQYEATCDTIAKIDARIGDLDTRLSKAIEDCADSLKAWVNVQLGAYYTAAQMDATVAELQAAIDTASAVAAATADSISTELTATKAAIDTAKANIRTEFRAAIETAIKTSEGKLTRALQDEIAIVNHSITALDRRVTKLETDVRALTVRVDALENMIQSVVIVPAYSDGSVKVDDKDSLYVDFIVNPVSAVANLKAGNVTVLVTKVLTKAFPSVDSIKIGTDDLFEKDAAKGAVSVRVSVADKIPTAADSTITVAVKVKNGVSNYTTEFVPVTVAAAKPIVEYVEIGGLKWATKNLGATTVAGSYTTCYGDLYQWGSVNTLYDGFPWTTATTGSFTWKTGKEGGFVEANMDYTGTDATLPDANDVVKQTIGGGWRMPTSAEFKALYDACLNDSYDTSTNPSGASDSVGKGVYWCTSYDGVAGCLFCDGTNKLFFPAAGNGTGTSLGGAGSSGVYWSSSLYTDNTISAYYLTFYSGGVFPQFSGYRYSGYSVRPVSD